jgi:hypothetical protein
MKQTAIEFFMEHAGYSYDPAKETKEQGRESCARELAAAESWAAARGYSFEWSVSDIDSSDFSDETPAWRLWDCVMRDADGHVVQSLGACDFGYGGEPFGQPYARVVRAELASEERHAVQTVMAGYQAAIQDHRRACLALLRETRDFRHGAARKLRASWYPNICEAVRTSIESHRAIIRHNREQLRALGGAV